LKDHKHNFDGFGLRIAKGKKLLSSVAGAFQNHLEFITRSKNSLHAS
jgi:hypothetical protein